MEEKIKEELKVYGLEVEDLTEDELKQLQEEIKSKGNGDMILDGVLSTINVYERMAKRMKI